MRRMIVIIAAGVLMIAFAPPTALAQVSADINLHIGSRPAPQVVFEREPAVVLIPRSHVYCVEDLDYDFFRFGGYWYINDGGYWYRSKNYRGPFKTIEFRRVPRDIVVLPSRYHHHPFHPRDAAPGQVEKTHRGGMRHDREAVVVKKKGNGKHGH